MFNKREDLKKRFIFLFNKLDDPKKKIFIEYILPRKQKHKFHMVSPSPWPLLTSISALILVLSIISWMHYYSYSLLNLFVGISCVLLSMYVWFRDIIRESVYMGYHTKKVQMNLRLGFTLFIVTEVMFFLGFFWALLHFSLCPSIFGGNIWPPEGIVNFYISKNINNVTFTYDFYHDYFNNFYSEFFSDSSYQNYNFGNPYSVYYSLVDSYWANKITTVPLMLNSEKEGWPYYDFYFPVPRKRLFFTPESLSYETYMKWKKIIFFNPKHFEPREFYIESAFTDFSFDNWRFQYAAYDFLANNPLTKETTSFNVNFYSPGVLVNPFSIPFLNTVILLSSGVFLTFSHICLKLHRFFRSIVTLAITILFGIFFFICQIYEYSHAGFSINDGVYGSVFYMLTGFHGFHVFVGTIFLIVCLIRFLYQHFTPAHHFGYEAAIWYWHFVDVVWILLFFLIYYWPNIFYFNKELKISVEGNSITLNDSILNYKDVFSKDDIDSIKNATRKRDISLIEVVLLKNKENYFSYMQNLKLNSNSETIYAGKQYINSLLNKG